VLRTSRTSTPWPDGSATGRRSWPGTCSADSSQRSWPPAGQERSGLAIVAAPYPSPDEQVVWTHEPEVPAAARVTVPLAAAAVRLLAVPIGVARRYPPAAAFDYARQTVRSRNRTMRSVLYDPSVAADLEGVRALDGRFPILLEHARDDRTVGLDAHERWRALLPNAEHRVVAGGHQAQLRDGFRSLPAGSTAWPGRLGHVDDTPALRALEGSDLAFQVLRTERARSAEESASFQGIELGQLLRTIVIRRGADDYVFVLVPGGRQIDWPKLRIHLGVTRLSLPDAEEAKAATGYERGTITPFGSSNPWPVIADARIPELERVAIGGGGHGVNLHLSGRDLVRSVGAGVADVTRPDSDATPKPTA